MSISLSIALRNAGQVILRVKSLYGIMDASIPGKAEVPAELYGIPSVPTQAGVPKSASAMLLLHVLPVQQTNFFMIYTQ